MEDDTELWIIPIDADLKAAVEEMIRPMGITQEQLIVGFFRLCVDEPEQAIAYLKKAQEEQSKAPHHD